MLLHSLHIGGREGMYVHVCCRNNIQDVFSCISPPNSTCYLQMQIENFVRCFKHCSKNLNVATAFHSSGLRNLWAPLRSKGPEILRNPKYGHLSPLKSESNAISLRNFNNFGGGAMGYSCSVWIEGRCRGTAQPHQPQPLKHKKRYPKKKLRAGELPSCFGFSWF